jgi:hypothetical protein
LKGKIENTLPEVHLAVLPWQLMHWASELQSSFKLIIYINEENNFHIYFLISNNVIPEHLYQLNNIFIAEINH